MKSSIKKHPKIVATIIFIITISIIIFIIGYNKDKDKLDKDGNKYNTKHHILEGFKWVGIIYGILLIISLIIAFVFSADFWTMFLLGGDFFSMMFTLIGQLILALAN